MLHLLRGAKGNGSVPVGLYKDRRATPALQFSAQGTLKESHLLHLGHHVVVDDFHVGVGHLHQDLDQHLGLLSGETLGGIFHEGKTKVNSFF